MVVGLMDTICPLLLSLLPIKDHIIKRMVIYPDFGHEPARFDDMTYGMMGL